MARSKVASEVTRERMTRIAAMTIEERLALLDRMREHGLSTYIELHRVIDGQRSLASRPRIVSVAGYR